MRSRSRSRGRRSRPRATRSRSSRSRSPTKGSSYRTSSAMAGYYPPVGFHFRVDVLGLPPNEHDNRFTDVSGLSVELSGEEVAEGGENRFVQKYPTRAKYPELVLKRGLLV